MSSALCAASERGGTVAGFGLRSVRFSAAPDKNRIKYGNYIRLYPKSGNDLPNRPCAQAALPLRCESRRFLWIAEIKNRTVIFQSGRTPGRSPRVCESCGPPAGRRPARPLTREFILIVRLKTSFRVSGQAGATPGGGLQLRCACFGSAGSGHETVVLTKYPRLLTLASKCG